MVLLFTKYVKSLLLLLLVLVLFLYSDHGLKIYISFIPVQLFSVHCTNLFSPKKITPQVERKNTVINE